MRSVAIYCSQLRNSILIDNNSNPAKKYKIYFFIDITGYLIAPTK